MRLSSKKQGAYMDSMLRTLCFFEGVLCKGSLRWGRPRGGIREVRIQFRWQPRNEFLHGRIPLYEQDSEHRAGECVTRSSMVIVTYSSTVSAFKLNRNAIWLPISEMSQRTHQIPIAGRSTRW